MSKEYEEFQSWANSRRKKYGEFAISDAAAKLVKTMNEIECAILIADAMEETITPELKIRLGRIMDAIEKINALEAIEKQSA
jgi:hypothetical protein